MSTITDNTAGVATPAFPAQWSLAELQDRLGDIPLDRIRLDPPIGYATVEDVQRIQETEGRLYELDLGVLVEKPTVWYESAIAVLLSSLILDYLKAADLGKVLGADGSLKILPGMVKIPDVSFISWKRFPKEKLPRGPIPHLIPDLAVEVLSESNTKREMQRKLEQYFESGVELVWYIDPATRSATAYTGVEESVRVDSRGSLDGGSVLPGFSVSLKWLFDEADRTGPKDVGIVERASDTENSRADRR